MHDLPCTSPGSGGGRVFGDLNALHSETRRLMAAAKDELKVPKLVQGTCLQVLYSGLASRLQGRGEGTQTQALSGSTWQPGRPTPERRRRA